MTRSVRAAALGSAAFLAACAGGRTQPGVAIDRAVPGFPAAWAGRWEGELEIWRPGATAPAQRVALAHEIGARPDASGGYRWRSVYANDTTRNMKDYRLRAVDSAAGRWATDEGNGLLLPARLVAGTLITVFSLGGQFFITREALRGDTLDFELTYWSAAAVDSSRGVGPDPNAEGGALLRGFAPLGMQRARLVRRRATR